VLQVYAEGKCHSQRIGSCTEAQEESRRRRLLQERRERRWRGASRRYGGGKAHTLRARLQPLLFATMPYASEIRAYG